MGTSVQSRTKLLWSIGILAMFSLSGCAMYPSKPGHWPGGVWGQLLQAVSKVIDFFANHLGGNYGIALLIVTILVRLLVLPLMVKQIRYSKMMQEMQPQIAKIKEKYRGDARKIQEETMKLWQQAGVNPMAGCLPMIVQLPILYALFGAIEGNIKLNQYTFLGIFHMGQADHYYILPILAAVTTFLSSRVTMTGNDQQTKMMLYIMPITVLLIGSRFASGLALYWIYGNIFTTIQSYFIKTRPAKASGLNEPAQPQKKGKTSSGADKDKGQDDNNRGKSNKGKNTKAKEGKVNQDVSNESDENKPSKRGSEQ